MQFMTENNAFPVDYRLVPVQDPEAKYAVPGASWAEPDIDHAAALLQRLRRDPDLVRAMGREAHASARAQLTAARFVGGLVGSAMLPREPEDQACDGIASGNPPPRP